MDKITGNVWLDNEVWFVITHEHVKAMNTEFLKKTEYLRHNEDCLNGTLLTSTNILRLLKKKPNQELGFLKRSLTKN